MTSRVGIHLSNSLVSTTCFAVSLRLPTPSRDASSSTFKNCSDQSICVMPWEMNVETLMRLCDVPRLQLLASNVGECRFNSRPFVRMLLNMPVGHGLLCARRRDSRCVGPDFTAAYATRRAFARAYEPESSGRPVKGSAPQDFVPQGGSRRVRTTRLPELSSR